MQTQSATSTPRGPSTPTRKKVKINTTLDRSQLPQEETCQGYNKHSTDFQPYTGPLGRGGKRQKHGYTGADGNVSTYTKNISRRSLNAEVGANYRATSPSDNSNEAIFLQFKHDITLFVKQKTAVDNTYCQLLQSPDLKDNLLQQRFDEVQESLLDAKGIWKSLLVGIDTNTPLPEIFTVVEDWEGAPCLDLTYHGSVEKGLITESQQVSYLDGLNQLDSDNEGLTTETCTALLKAFHAYCRTENIDKTVTDLLSDKLKPQQGRIPVSQLFQYLDFQFSAIADDDYPGWSMSKYPGDGLPKSLMDNHKEFMKDWLVWVLVCLTKVTTDGKLAIRTPEEIDATKHTLKMKGFEHKSLGHHRSTQDVPETNTETASKEDEPSAKDLEYTSKNLIVRPTYRRCASNPLGDEMVQLLEKDIPEKLEQLKRSTTLRTSLKKQLIKKLKEAKDRIKKNQELSKVVTIRRQRNSSKDAAKLVRDSIKKKKRNRKTQSAPTEVTPPVSTKIIQSAPAELLPRQQLTEQVKARAFNANVFG